MSAVVAATLVLLAGDVGFLLLVRRLIRRVDREMGAGAEAETSPCPGPPVEERDPDELLALLELRVKGAIRASS